MIYKDQFLETLKHGIYKGSGEHADLRIIYQDVINALKQFSIIDSNGEYPVIITEADGDFIEKRTKAVLELAIDGFGKYDKQRIMDTVMSHTNEINAHLRAEAKDMHGSIMQLFTTAELRKKGFLR